MRYVSALQCRPHLRCAVGACAVFLVRARMPLHPCCCGRDATYGRDSDVDSRLQDTTYCNPKYTFPLQVRPSACRPFCMCMASLRRTE